MPGERARATAGLARWRAIATSWKVTRARWRGLAHRARRPRDLDVPLLVVSVLVVVTVVLGMPVIVVHVVDVIAVLDGLVPALLSVHVLVLLVLPVLLLLVHSSNPPPVLRGSASRCHLANYISCMDAQVLLPQRRRASTSHRERSG